MNFNTRHGISLQDAYDRSVTKKLTTKDFNDYYQHINRFRNSERAYSKILFMLNYLRSMYDTKDNSTITVSDDDRMYIQHDCNTVDCDTKKRIENNKNKVFDEVSANMYAVNTNMLGGEVYKNHIHSERMYIEQNEYAQKVEEYVSQIVFYNYIDTIVKKKRICRTRVRHHCSPFQNLSVGAPLCTLLFFWRGKE